MLGQETANDKPIFTINMEIELQFTVFEAFSSSPKEMFDKFQLQNLIINCYKVII